MAIIGVSSLLSCEKRLNEESVEIKELSSQNDLDYFKSGSIGFEYSFDPNFVAEKHNEGLHYLQNFIPNECKPDIEHEPVLCIASLLDRYAVNQGVEENDLMYLPNVLGFKDIELFEKNVGIVYSQAFWDNYFSIKEIFFSNLPDQEIIDQLLSYELTSSVTNAFEENLLVTFRAVGIRSMQFWIENGFNWANELKNFRKADDSFNWSAIAFADAAGAVSTASGLFVSGTGQAMIAAGGLAGAGGVGMVIAAGAIGSSASAFVGQALFGGWFD